MKKSILAVAVILGATSTFAQDLTSRKGENYLPQAGDWAIGIDAVPVLNYVGNFFGKTADNNYAGSIWNLNAPNFTINGKYFVEEGLAYRGSVRLGFGSASNKVMVADRSVDPATPNPWPSAPAEVENTWKQGGTNIGLSAGIEKRKGNTRLQGFYGAEVGFFISTSSNKFTYGNALTSSAVANPVNVSIDDEFLSDINNPLSGVNLGNANDGQGINRATRLLSEKSGLGFGLGLRAFIGAEYFVLPKLSIGGELGWGLGFSIQGKGTNVYEMAGLTATGTSTQVAEITTETGKASSFGFDNSVVNPLFGPAGRLNLTFHF